MSWINAMLSISPETIRSQRVGQILCLANTQHCTEREQRLNPKLAIMNEDTKLSNDNEARNYLTTLKNDAVDKLCNQERDRRAGGLQGCRTTYTRTKRYKFVEPASKV